VQARSALFDLFGDYLRPHGGRAPVAALVKLLAPLGIAAPAVRTAVSRMVRQGWLHPLRLSSGPGYLLTPKAVRRLDESAARIYRTNPITWDGTFDMLLIEAPGPRTDRLRLAASLAFLGYGRLADNTWIAPRPAQEAAALLAEAGVGQERFRARHSGGAAGAAALVRRAWDLEALGSAYRRFVVELRPVVATVAGQDDEAAYAARFQLVHAWRGFLFRDPQLPPELLPSPWPGDAAAGFFDEHAGRLRPAADRYVAARLEQASRPGPTRRGAGHPARPEPAHRR
jgi:phenylacetic acid degradation operon negative regulatory protein